MYRFKDFSISARTNNRFVTGFAIVYRVRISKLFWQDPSGLEALNKPFLSLRFRRPVPTTITVMSKVGSLIIATWRSTGVKSMVVPP
jgi:hypothetical protein